MKHHSPLKCHDLMAVHSIVGKLQHKMKLRSLAGVSLVTINAAS